MLSAWLYGHEDGVAGASAAGSGATASAAGSGATEIEPADISDHIGKPGRLVWVDVTEPGDADLERIQEEFSLHPLAVEDVRHRFQRPKLENYPTHSFVVAYSSSFQEIDVFVGPNWVITVRERAGEAPPWSADSARKRFDRAHPEPPSPGFLLYVILDELVDGYFEAIDRAEDALEQLEERIFAEQPQEEHEVQRDLFEARRRLVMFRRTIVPMRDLVAALMRREVPWVDDHTAIFLQDVYDHVLRAVDSIDAQRELMGNAVDAHFAIISNHMNSVMKRMTSWGAILLVSTLISGIYGMNFVHVPTLEWRFGFLWALGLMALVTLVGYRYFKRKDWL